MDSCPTTPDVVVAEESTNDCFLEASKVTISQGDEHFTKVKSLLTSAISLATKFKSILKGKGKYSEFAERLYNHDENNCFKSWISSEELNVLTEVNECLSEVDSYVKDILNVFSMKDEGDVNPMSRCLHHLKNKIENTQRNFNLKTEIIKRLTTQGEIEISSLNDNDEERKSVETFLSKILFSIQEFYKMIVQKESEFTENPMDHSENKECKKPSDSDLKEKIVRKLQTGVNLLSTKEIITEFLLILTKSSCKDNIRGSYLAR